MNKVLKAKFWPDEDGKQVGPYDSRFESATQFLTTITVEEECAGNRGRGPLWYVSPIHANIITLLILSRV